MYHKTVAEMFTKHRKYAIKSQFFDRLLNLVNF